MKCNYQEEYVCPFYFRITDKNLLSVREEQVKLKKEFIDENLRIPVFYGAFHKYIIDNINNNIRNDIMEFKREMEEAADKYGAEMKSAGQKNIIPYGASNIYIVTYNENNILSVSIVYDEYIKMRHYYIRAPYNFDLSTGKSMSVKDLFISGTDYRKLINNEIVNELRRNSSKYFPGAAQNFKEIAIDQPFYIEDGNIVLFFGFNEIAPSASEIPAVKLPFTLFRGHIKPQFLKLSRSYY